MEAVSESGSSGAGRPFGASLRDAIIEKARVLLTAEGFAGLSMRRIARAVGCSATSIYLHFESKDDLVHSLIEQGFERLYDDLEQAAAEADAPTERLERLCRAYLAFGLDNPEYYEAMFSLRADEMSRFPPEKYRRARRNLRLFANAIGALGTEAESASDAEAEASAAWATLHGAVSLLLAERLDARLDEQVFLDAIVRQVASAYGRPDHQYAG